MNFFFRMYLKDSFQVSMERDDVINIELFFFMQKENEKYKKTKDIFLALGRFGILKNI